MENLIVESEHFKKIISEITPSIVGEPILRSLSEQRRKNILCDVLIECRNQQITAHRCVLYAMSKYCVTLFTGSIPPTYRNGMAVMDLDLFSLDTVQIFIDLIYGEESTEVSSIDVGELMRLFDYLQVHGDILAAIFSKIVNTDNYMLCYELALSYHFEQLQKMLEVYIANNLQTLIESPNWELSDRAMSSLHKNPVYLSKPVEIIGAIAKKNLSRVNTKPVLISYNEKLAKLRPQSNIVTVNNESQVARYKQAGNIQYGYYKNIIYFVFNYELYSIEIFRPRDVIMDYVICKYDQKERRFDKFVSLFESTNGSNRSGYEEALSKAEILMIVSTISDEHIFIIFGGSYSKLLLMQLNMIKEPKPTSLQINLSTATGYRGILYNRNIYFLIASEYWTYNLDSKVLTTRHRL